MALPSAIFLLELTPLPTPLPFFNQDYLARDFSFYVPPKSYIEERRFETPGRYPDYGSKCESLRSLMF